MGQLFQKWFDRSRGDGSARETGEVEVGVAQDCPAGAERRPRGARPAEAAGGAGRSCDWKRAPTVGINGEKQIL